ncbi:tyrosine-protein phosphatase [Enterococcus hirae]|nr:tyrosine-protein phosphatase [Enterococcus hirae]
MNQLLALEGTMNTRDLGGYQTKNGIIKPRLLIRSDSLDQLTPQDQEYLQTIGIEKIIDFRSPAEQAANPDPIIDGIQNLSLPVFPTDETESKISPEELFQLVLAGHTGSAIMEKVYADFINETFSRKTYQRFFEEALTSSGGIVFHCTQGKDRTGMGAYLLLSAFQTAAAVVNDDYLQTNRYLAPRLGQMLNQAKAKGADEKILDSIRALMEARLNYLEETEKTLRAQFGTVEAFLTEGLGFANSDIKDLQKKFLTE